MQGFSKITASLISILKIIVSADLASKTLRVDDNEFIEIGDKADKTFENLSKSRKSKNNKSRNLTYVLITQAMKKSTFLTPSTRKVFNFLRQIFIKALIL